jgi:hypothetical protein
MQIRIFGGVSGENVCQLMQPSLSILIMVIAVMMRVLLRAYCDNDSDDRSVILAAFPFEHIAQTQ